MGVLLILWPQHHHVKKNEDKQEGLDHINFSSMYSKGKRYLHERFKTLWLESIQKHNFSDSSSQKTDSPLTCTTIEINI